VLMIFVYGLVGRKFSVLWGGELRGEEGQSSVGGCVVDKVPS